MTAPPADPAAEDASEPEPTRAPLGLPPAVTDPATRGTGEADENAMSRINLRMPDHLKGRIEQAAGSEGLSVNAWLVRAAAVALERPAPDRRRERRAPQSAQRYTGWVRTRAQEPGNASRHITQPE